jgi:hypothetical protein
VTAASPHPALAARHQRAEAAKAARGQTKRRRQRICSRREAKAAEPPPGV